MDVPVFEGMSCDDKVQNLSQSKQNKFEFIHSTQFFADSFLSW